MYIKFYTSTSPFGCFVIRVPVSIILKVKASMPLVRMRCCQRKHFLELWIFSFSTVQNFDVFSKTVWSVICNLFAIISDQEWSALRYSTKFPYIFHIRNVLLTLAAELEFIQMFYLHKNAFRFSYKGQRNPNESISLSSTAHILSLPKELLWEFVYVTTEIAIYG